MSNPVIDVAKEQQKGNVRTLSTGVRVRLVPVPSLLVTQVTTRIKDPEVPMAHDEKKGRDIPNPFDPAYKAAVERTNSERGIAAMEALAMFGIELVDGVPEDDLWVKKLQLVGIEFDPDDPVEREFTYKKYVALGNEDLLLVGKMAGMSEEDLQQAEQSFRGDS